MKIVLLIALVVCALLGVAASTSAQCAGIGCGITIPTPDVPEITPAPPQYPGQAPDLTGLSFHLPFPADMVDFESCAAHYLHSREAVCRMALAIAAETGNWAHYVAYQQMGVCQ